MYADDASWLLLVSAADVLSRWRNYVAKQ